VGGSPAAASSQPKDLTMKGAEARLAARLAAPVGS